MSSEFPPATDVAPEQYPAGWPVDSDWTPALAPLFATPQFQALQAFVDRERGQFDVFPPVDRVYSAFALTPLSKVRVVIIGQDPYHGPGQAEGLSFSVPLGTKHPPSLRNIFRELAADIGCSPPTSGSLRGWAEQGVFLLNSVLTVRHGEAHSHAGRGWEWFTDEVLRKISERLDPVLFLLWGAAAQGKTQLIQPPHAWIASAHPSPLSAHRGFLGSRPFSTANEWLQKNKQPPIDWSSND